MKKPTKTQLQRAAVVNAVLAAGFREDGTTPGGRARYTKPGTDMHVTVGPKTTNVYYILNGKTEFLAKLGTRNIVPASLTAKLIAWSAEEICGAPGCNASSGHETYCEKHRDGAGLRHAYKLAHYPYPEDHT